MSESTETSGDEAHLGQEAGSFLVFDRGEDGSKAHLFDMVEGTPRFLASVNGSSDGESTLLLENLEQASARSLLKNGILVSPQRNDGDGVDVILHLVDLAAEDGPSDPEPWLATAVRVDRATAGRTALDLLARGMGRVLLALDFDIDAAPSSDDPAPRSAYSSVRDAVAGIGAQLDGNDGRSTVNVIEVGPSLLCTPLGATLLAIVDGCGLRPRSGILALAADREGLLLPLGAIATVAPGIAEAIVKQDFLLPLGSYLAIEPPEGEEAEVLNGTLSFDSDMPARGFTLGAGSLLRLELERGASAELTLELASGARLGDFPAAEPIRLRAPETITGGTLGIILDARRCSPNLAEDTEALARWLDDLRLT